MGQRTPGTEYLSITGLVTAPLGGNAAARLVTLNADALDAGSVLIPAARGNTFFKFGALNTVDAAGDATDDGCIVEGGEVNVQIPIVNGVMVGYLSIKTDHTAEYNIPINVIR